MSKEPQNDNFNLHGDYNPGAQAAEAVHGDAVSSTDSQPSLEAGVRKAELIAATWGRKQLVIAYLGVLLMAASVSFGEQLNYQLMPFATSSFKLHSQVSTVTTVANVLLAVAQPPIAKLADVYGRMEGFFIALAIYVLGHLIAATSTNVHAFTVATIFQSVGVTALKMLQQLFIIDTSSLRNRMLCASIPDIPFMVVIWVAPFVTERLKTHWGWGYGMWAIITPIVSAPLILSLFFQQRRLKKQHKLHHPNAVHVRQEPFTLQKLGRVVLSFWFKLDIGGLIILTAGFTCLLLPLSVTKTSWKSPGTVGPLVFGVLLLFIFPFFETQRRVAPSPLLSKTALTTPSVYLSCILMFFYFMAYFLSLQPYMFSYLLVTRNLSIQTAGYVMNTFNISCTISVLVAGYLCKRFSVYKPFLLFGVIAYTIAIGLMLHFRISGTSTDKVGWIVFSQALVGSSAGFVNGPAQLGMQANIGHNDVATCTAFWLTTMSLGGAVGSSVSGAIWQWGVKHYLRKRMAPETTAERIEEIFGDVEVARGLEWKGADRVAVVAAYEDTMKMLLIVAGCMCLPLLPCAWGMRGVDLKVVDERREREMANTVGEEAVTMGEKGERGGVEMKGLVRV